MGDWTKIKANRTLSALAIYSFVVTTAEGLIYFSTYEDIFFRVLLTIQNTIKAFTFKTTISLEAARSFMLNDPTPLKTVLGYAYMLAVFTAPYCTIAAVYKLLEKALKLRFWFRRADKKERILVFGYNDITRKLLESADRKTQRIHVVCCRDISDEDRYKLLVGKIQLHIFDLLQAKEKEVIRLLRNVELKKATKIMLFEEDPAQNLSLLQTIGDTKDLAENAKIFCRCEDAGIRQLIETYYDHEQHNRFDLEIFDLFELQARQMYETYPLHSYWLDETKQQEQPAADMDAVPRKALGEIPVPRETPDKWRLHLLILGFGALGQQALLQAMHLGVAHSANEMWIDVIDENIDKKKNVFLNHFATNALLRDGTDANLYRANKAWADGDLTIRFHKVDVWYGSFREELEKMSDSSAGGFTYAIVAIDHLNTGARCATELRRFIQKNDKDGMQRVPILLRMDSDQRFKKYIETKGGGGIGLDGVRIIPDAGGILTFDNIFGAEWDKAAKQCNAYYANMSFDAEKKTDAKPKIDFTDTEQVEAAWRKLSLFRRNSSRAAAYHNMFLSDILSATYSDLNVPEAMEKIFTGETKLIEHKNGTWTFSLGDDAFLAKVDGTKSLSPEYAFALEMLKAEHRRWCYYMITSGWEPPMKNGKDVKKSDELHINPCLVPWDKLTEYQPESCKYDLMPLMAEYEKEHEVKKAEET